MDQGMIKNLKVQYRKQIVARKISAIEKDSDFNVSILDALRMLKSAWTAVTAVTIQNCYRHAGFQKEASETPESTVPEEDIEDDIPLAQLVRVMGFFCVSGSELLCICAICMCFDIFSY